MSARLNGPTVRGLDSPLEFKSDANQTPSTPRETYPKPTLQHAQTIAVVDEAGRSAIENAGNSSPRLSERGLSELNLKPTPDLALPSALANLSRSSSVESASEEDRTPPLRSDKFPGLRSNPTAVRLQSERGAGATSPDIASDSGHSQQLNTQDGDLSASLIGGLEAMNRSRSGESANSRKSEDPDYSPVYETDPTKSDETDQAERQEYSLVSEGSLISDHEDEDQSLLAAAEKNGSRTEDLD